MYTGRQNKTLSVIIGANGDLSESQAQEFPTLKTLKPLERISNVCDWDMVEYALVVVCETKGAFCIGVGTTMEDCRKNALEYLVPDVIKGNNIYSRRYVPLLAACTLGESILFRSVSWPYDSTPFFKVMMCRCEAKLYIQFHRYPKKVFNVIFESGLDYAYARFAGLSKKFQRKDIQGILAGVSPRTKGEESE